MTLTGDRLSVSIYRHDRTVVVQVAGELDHSTAGPLRCHLDDLIEGQGNLSVAVDLTDLTFIDSTGLSVLLEALKLARQLGGDMILRRPRPPVSRVFEIVGLNEIFSLTQ